MDCSWIEPNLLAAGSIPVSAADLQALRMQGVRALLSLTERPLTAFRGISVALLHQLDLRYFHIPIPDQFPPSFDQAAQILSLLHEMAVQHRPVFVHCQAGVGRTGTILHLYYLAQGKSLAEAQALVKTRRIQCELISTEQHKFLETYAQQWPGIYLASAKTKPLRSPSHPE